MKILVLGASGLIGSTFLRVLTENNNWKVFGTVRSALSKQSILSALHTNVISDLNVLNNDRLLETFDEVRPNVVVNCAGLTKHDARSSKPTASLPINSIFPHKLSKLCDLMSARLIHLSSDCVFAGKKGGYKEEELTDATDLYGISKALGEVINYRAITIRTSTIGHEKFSKDGLLEWFLSQDESCNGYSQAFFSGLPTVILARLVRDVIIPNEKLVGLHHLSAEPISKLHLLQMISEVYSKNINIISDDSFIIDRSLNSSKFYKNSGYMAPQWRDMINIMYEDYLRNYDV
jgi:dTDP-4-dehydrorhamnose reductase